MSIAKAATMQMLQETSMEKNVDSDPWNVQGMIMEDSSNDACETIVSNNEDSDDSVTSSSSSSELVEDDDASSGTPSPLSPSFGPLFELSELMAHLPIKRGLSKYYHGKSQSFTSLASVRNLGDLAKKGSSYNQRMKSCRSYGCGLDGRKYGPKATITKKSSRGAFISSVGSRNRPSISIEKTF